MKNTLLLLLCLVLFGCASSDQIGVQKEIEVPINITVTNNTGDVFISPATDWNAIAGDTDQESAAAAEASPDFTLPIAQQGGVASADSEIEGVQAKQDNKDQRHDYDKPTTTTTTTTTNYITNPKDGESTAIPVPSNPAEYSSTGEIIIQYDDCGDVNNRSHHWFYGVDKPLPPFKATWPNCNISCVVEDPEHNQNFPNATDDKCAYFSGNDADEDFPPPHVGAIFSKTGCLDSTVIIEKFQ